MATAFTNTGRTDASPKIIAPHLASPRIIEILKNRWCIFQKVSANFGIISVENYRFLMIVSCQFFLAIYKSYLKELRYSERFKKYKMIFFGRMRLFFFQTSLSE